MSISITADECRQRLQLAETDISDTILNSAAYIPFADAWMGLILSENSATEASLTANEEALIKTAKIAKVCQKIVTDANLEKFKVGGMVEGEPVRAVDKETMYNILSEEISNILNVLGYVERNYYVDSAGGSNYDT